MAPFEILQPVPSDDKGQKRRWPPINETRPELCVYLLRHGSDGSLGETLPEKKMGTQEL